MERKSINGAQVIDGAQVIAGASRPHTHAVLTSTLRQRFARNFLVVEVENFAADDLIVLVAFAGNQHQIITARFRNRLVNRFAAVGDFS